MLLAPIIEDLQDDLVAAAALGGDDARRAAELLTTALRPAMRLRLLEALQRAAEELEGSLPDATIEVRLVDGEPELRVAEAPERTPAASVPAELDGAEAGMARLTVRMPEGLKSQVESAAVAAGTSVNTWLVAAASQALRAPTTTQRGPRRMTGFVRG